MLSKTPQEKTFEVGGEIFSFEIPNEIEEDLVSFYYNNWEKEHETPEYRGIFNKNSREILEHYLGKLFLLRDSSGEIAAISIPDQVILDSDEEGVGTIIVSKNQRRKGLATYLSKERIFSLIEKNPDIKKIDSTAATIEGLQCLLSLTEKVKKFIDLDINYTEETLEEIIESVINKFKDEVKKEGFFGVAQDLRDEGKLKIAIPKTMKRELFEEYDVEKIKDLVIDDILTYVFKKNGIAANIDLFKIEDKEELRNKLKGLGIIIVPPKEYEVE